MKEKFNRKYDLIKDDVRWDEARPHYRIRAMRDFADVKAGDLGGFVGGQSVLSHEGNAWIGGDALVDCACRVAGNARVDCMALISGGCRIEGDAHVGGAALVSGSVQVDGRARIDGNAQAYSGRVTGNAHLTGRATLDHGLVDTGTYSDGFLGTTLAGRLYYTAPAGW